MSTIITTAFRGHLKTSRPRFWIYLLGPYLIGLVAWWWVTTPDQFIWLFSVQVVWFLVYFSYPANLLVYGVNDIFDYETDKLNDKKTWYEWLITPDMQKHLWSVIILLNIPFLLLSILPNARSYIWLFVFVLSAVLYSAPPLRAKSKPVIDTIISALIYIAPGYVWYYISWGVGFDRMIFVALMGWNMAMHAYSAIPDIASDIQAWIQTVATRYGKTNTLLFCIACYLLALILAAPALGLFGIAIWSIYVLMMLISLKQDVFRLYTYFPWINTTVGLLLFRYILLSQLGRL